MMLLAQIPVGPVKPATTTLAYLVRADVSALAVGGATAAEQTALARSSLTTGWKIQSEAWYVTTTRPTGYAPRTVAEIVSAWAARPGLRADERQAGYQRETGAGLATWGDVSKGMAIRYRTVLTVFCGPSDEIAAALKGVYSLGRPLHPTERGGVTDWAALGVAPMRWDALDSTAQVLPETVATTLPTLPATPYDVADEVTGPDELPPTKSDAQRQQQPPQTLAKRMVYIPTICEDRPF